MDPKIEFYHSGFPNTGNHDQDTQVSLTLQINSPASAYLLAESPQQGAELRVSRCPKRIDRSRPFRSPCLVLGWFSLGFCPFSLGFLGCCLFPLIFLGFCPFWPGFPWLSLDLCTLALVSLGYSLVFHWFPMVSLIIYWFPLAFGCPKGDHLLLF